MYLDRTDISLRTEDLVDLQEKQKITIFRPGNRIYPQNRGYTSWEVVKARIISIPWSDEKWIPPTFSEIVELVKIQTTTLLDLSLSDIDFSNSLHYIQSREDLTRWVDRIYKKDFTLVTQIDMTKLSKENLIDNSEEIRELFKSGIMTFATLPENNVTNLDELLNASSFSITFINHDYAGITPKMWNYISNLYHLDIKSSMVIIKPEDFEKCLQVLQKNNKYIWGGLWVWFKDLWWKILWQTKWGFINPVANEMQSTNFLAHFWDELHWYNSDASWYVDSLCDKFTELWTSIVWKDIVLLWAWGTARWISLELVNRGVKSIKILNRTKEKAQYISDRLNKIRENVSVAWDENMIFEITSNIDAIINLSTKGADWEFELYSWLVSSSWGVERNINDSKDLLMKLIFKNSSLIVSDINLTKSWETPLLKIARDLGINSLDWKLMVVYQGVQAMWTVFWDQIIRAWGTKQDLQDELLKLITKNN